jgi:hypothetical protein
VLLCVPWCFTYQTWPGLNRSVLLAAAPRLVLWLPKLCTPFNTADYNRA